MEYSNKEYEEYRIKSTQEMKPELLKLVEKAKQIVKDDWYSKDTKRKWLSTYIWSTPPYGGNLIEVIILEGGEAKGTIIVDYFNSTIELWDIYHHQRLTLIPESTKRSKIEIYGKGK